MAQAVKRLGRIGLKGFEHDGNEAEDDESKHRRRRRAGGSTRDTVTSTRLDQRTRRQVGGRNPGYPSRVTRPLGVENEARLDRSSGHYESEDKIPRDDYAKGGSTEAGFRTKSGSVSAAGRSAAKAAGETQPGTDKFPIRNKSDLANAKQSIGRSNTPGATRAWINRRARELGEPPLGE
jgi:hypothetical protein